jgi:Tfp pilus assembly protein PilX
MNPRNDCGRNRQRGATLIVALITLLLMTMVALTTLNMGRSSLQIVGNLQGRNQEVVTANAANEQVISSTQFFNNPSGTLNVGGTWTNSSSMDIYGDGKTVLTVNVLPAPKCVVAQPILLASLVLSNPDDLACSEGAQQNFGVAGSNTSASLCANSTWEVATQASDTINVGSATVVQGVAVRIPIAAEATSCP